MTAATLWTIDPPAGLAKRLTTILDRDIPAGYKTEVFFRADDIAVNDDNFRHLMRLFIHHRCPLCLAVVPAWLDPDGWQQIQEYVPEDPLWCWHQHGYSHTNHQRHGKKSEFGSDREGQAIQQDLERGCRHLQAIIGPLLCPVFTPPWNRCSQDTLQTLHKLGFAAVSRSRGALPTAADPGLPELSVNVDLHTRKERDPQQGWQNLLEEFALAARNGRMGIMLHHQLMNRQGLDFLDILLPLLRSHPKIRLCTFRDLL